MVVKKYVSIGHWKGSENVTALVEESATKTAFKQNLKGNGFVAYLVINLELLEAMPKGWYEAYESMKHMVRNIRQLDTVVDYVVDCWNIIEEKAQQC